VIGNDKEVKKGRGESIPEIYVREKPIVEYRLRRKGNAREVFFFRKNFSSNFFLHGLKAFCLRCE
jgi:hypothetical protein